MPPRANRVFLHRAAIPLAAFLAIIPLLGYGPSCGHDFEFHLVSWFEAATQFAHGTYPHWAYTPAYGAGEPRFVFYPPLSWALGGLLGLTLPWTLVPAAFTWIALTLSGFTAYRLARQYAEPAAALFAAIFYLANPYMLFTAYERTAYGELLAAAFIPLLFQAALFTRPLQVDPLSPRPYPLLSVAVPIALLWLSNAPAAVMGCYTLAFFTLVRLFDVRGLRLSLALRTSAGALLGLALAAFYIIPAAYERRFVQADMALVDGMRIVDNTLFHHMAYSLESWYHDQVVRTASLLALMLLAAIAVMLAATRIAARRKLQFASPSTSDSRLTTAWLLASLTLLIAFLLTPYSLPLWSHIPELRFLQFPWRLMLLLATSLAILLALALGHRRIPLVVSALLAIVLIVPAWHSFHQRCEPKDTIPARLALFRSALGTEATDEYTPLGADSDSLHPEDPPYWLVALPAASPDDQVNNSAPTAAPPGPCPHHLALTLSEPEYLILNCRQYPAWQVEVNHRNATPHTPERDDGLITLLLPAGLSNIDLVEHHTPDQTIGLALSGLATLYALALWQRERRETVLPDGPTARGAVTS